MGPRRARLPLPRCCPMAVKSIRRETGFRWRLIPLRIAVSPNGAQIAVPSIGFPFALNIVNLPDTAKATVTRMPAGHENDPKMEVHAGLAYSPDSALLYVATGESGKIRAYSTADWHAVGEVSLDGPLSGNNFGGSFAATLVVSADGKTLYALDQGNWRVVVLDAEHMERIASIATGAYPFWPGSVA